MKHRIIVIDDELQIRRFMRISLLAEGFEYYEAKTATDGLSLIRSVMPNLIVLDLGLPDKDGLWVLQQLRMWSKIPVLILTARDAEEEKVKLLNSGANDYLSKPFGIKELIARIRVLLRDLQEATRSHTDGILHFDQLTIDLPNRLVWRQNVPVKLARKEFALLALLAQQPGKLINQKELLLAIWGNHHTEDGHYLRILVSQLRKKLEEETSTPRYIINEPGIGYRFNPSTCLSAKE